MEEKTQIEEKRVKSTVIRRRKTVNPVEETVPPAQSAPETLAETPKVAVTAATQETPPASDQVAAPSLVEAKPGQTATEIKSEPSVSSAGVGDKTVQTAQASSAPPAPPVKKSMVGQIIQLPKPPPPKVKGAPIVVTPDEEEESDDKDKKTKVKKPVKKKGSGREFVEVDGIGKVSSITQLTRIVHTDRVERVFEPSRIGKRKKILSKKSMQATPMTVTKAAKRVVEMDKAITVGDLARAMNVKASEVIKKLMGMGSMVTMNHVLDHDTAVLIAHEFQYEIKDVSFNENKILEDANKGVEQKLEPRAPVVTVMGHVDHGKTSLLDAIRASNVTEGEFGGITQHIGAYTVTCPKGKITFLDTPGHEAFTAMRARGASVTDIVILVVAADDGVMPQTIESIDHAKAAKVPIVVAVNKIDKPEANLDRIKRQLSELGLMPEEWGGETLYTYVSAKKKEGIDELLETIMLQAEVLDLKADPYLKARGIVIEARLDKNRGPVATVLVQQGTLRIGDSLVAGCYAGRIRAMLDYHGAHTTEAPPSYAVEILGLEGVPQASDPFHVTVDDQAASEIAKHRQDQKRQAQLAVGSKVSLEDFFAKSGQAETKELNIILKTDVQGSLEAIREALVKLSTEKVKIKIIHTGVGGINESDVLLASASNAVVIGFNVRPETKAISVAESEGIDVKVYKIIYEMVSDVKLAMRGLLAPTRKEKYLGRAEIRQTFTVSSIGTVAGCYVIDGKIVRGTYLRLLRDNVIIHEGKISTLKRFKDDAKEVSQGFECGLSVEGYQDVKIGDVIEAFEVELVEAEL